MSIFNVAERNSASGMPQKVFTAFNINKKS